MRNTRGDSSDRPASNKSVSGFRFPVSGSWTPDSRNYAVVLPPFKPQKKGKRNFRFPRLFPFQSIQKSSFNPNCTLRCSRVLIEGSKMPGSPPFFAWTAGHRFTPGARARRCGTPCLADINRVGGRIGRAAYHEQIGMIHCVKQFAPDLKAYFFGEFKGLVNSHVPVPVIGSPEGVAGGHISGEGTVMGCSLARSYAVSVIRKREASG